MDVEIAQLIFVVAIILKKVIQIDFIDGVLNHKGIFIESKWGGKLDFKNCKARLLKIQIAISLNVVNFNRFVLYQKNIV